MLRSPTTSSRDQKRGQLGNSLTPVGQSSIFGQKSRFSYWHEICSINVFECKKVKMRSFLQKHSLPECHFGSKRSILGIFPLIYKRKSRGPKIEPWGTPYVTFLNEDVLLPRSTICFLLDKYDLDQSFISDLTP